MSSKLTLILYSDTTSLEFFAICRRVLHWTIWAATLSGKPSIQIILEGGPEMSCDDTLKMVRELFPVGLVEDVLVDGCSLEEEDAIDVEWRVVEKAAPPCTKN